MEIKKCINFLLFKEAQLERFGPSKLIRYRKALTVTAVIQTDENANNSLDHIVDYIHIEIFL